MKNWGQKSFKRVLGNIGSEMPHSVAGPGWPARALFLFSLGLVLALMVLIAVRANAEVRHPSFSECGLASVYGTVRDGHAWSATASGERMDPKGLTAAHRSLPLGSRIAVRSLAHLGTGGQPLRVVVRINDRGPFVAGRVIDLSPASAKMLGFADDLLPVCLELPAGAGQAR